VNGAEKAVTGYVLGAFDLDLVEQAVRGLFFERRFPADTADEMTDEVMAIIREHAQVIKTQAAS
jgi:hypothetical protein